MSLYIHTYIDTHISFSRSLSLYILLLSDTCIYIYIYIHITIYDITSHNIGTCVIAISPRPLSAGIFAASSWRVRVWDVRFTVKDSRIPTWMIGGLSKKAL